MSTKHLYSPNLDDLIFTLQMLRGTYGNLPVNDYRHHQTTIKLSPVKSDYYTTADSPAEAISLQISLS